MFSLGDVVPLSVEIRNPDGVLTDAATVTLTITLPDGSTDTPTITNPPASTGVYVHDYVTTQSGRHHVRWISTSPAAAYTDAFDVAGASTVVVPSEMVPTPAQVHALIPMRPVFTASSRPSLAEVQALIDLTTEAIGSEVETTIPAHLAGKVRFLIALSAASQVEAAYWPEQQIGDESPAQLLYARFTDELAGLRRLLADAEGVTGAARTPAYALPLASSPIVYDYPPSYWVV